MKNIIEDVLELTGIVCFVGTILLIIGF